MSENCDVVSTSKGVAQGQQGVDMSDEIHQPMMDDTGFDSTVREATPSSGSSRPSKGLWIVVGILVVVLTVVAGFLAVTAVERAKLADMNAEVGDPVAEALDSDLRNAVFSLSAHLGDYEDPIVLVLNLEDVGNAAPVDLWRGLFQSAGAFSESGRTFDRVIMARSDSAVFVLDGQDFADLGYGYSNGQNPLYLIRTLPEKLQTPDGASAFGSWTGGLIAVTAKQMEDANEAALQWTVGQ